MQVTSFYIAINSNKNTYFYNYMLYTINSTFLIPIINQHPQIFLRKKSCSIRYHHSTCLHSAQSQCAKQLIQDIHFKTTRMKEVAWDLEPTTDLDILRHLEMLLGIHLCRWDDGKDFFLRFLPIFIIFIIFQRTCVAYSFSFVACRKELQCSTIFFFIFDQ